MRVLKKEYLSSDYKLVNTKQIGMFKENKSFVFEVFNILPLKVRVNVFERRVHFEQNL